MKTMLFFLAITFWACESQNKATNTNTTFYQKHKTKGYVLQKNEGEVLKDQRGRTVIIKVSPETGSAHLAMGSTEMPKGSNIVIHQHDHAEEILFVHRGNGMAIIDGDSIDISEGSTLFIPAGTWHGVNNPNDSMNILFIVTPQGQEKVFRALAAPPGTWTTAQIDSIRKQVGTFLKVKQ